MLSMTPHPHAEDAESCLKRLATRPSGLSQDEVACRLAEHGPNRLPEAPRRPALVRFALHFHNVLMHVLLGAAAVTATPGHMIDTWVILAVVFVNAIMGFVQEGRAENAMAAIRQMLAPHASVMREGVRISIDTVDLVPGDIVVLEPGDRIAADLRLLHINSLNVKEAVLTGESMPVEKTIEPVAQDAVLGDRSSMAFSGTLVTSGTGRGVVVATGSRSEIGKISGMLGRVEELKTPLIVQMDMFARWLTVLIMLVSGALLAFGYYVRHLEFEPMFMAVVSLAVSAIPEALPAVMTITLAVGVQAMAKRHAIVKRLPAIETIGAVSVICTDKTGTLTRNEMMVASVVAADGKFSVTGGGYAPEDDIRHESEGNSNQALAEIARAALLCNDAALRSTNGIWSVDGDPMEDACDLRRQSWRNHRWMGSKGRDSV